MTIFGGVLTILAVLLIPETNPHVLLQRRAEKMRKETGDDRWHANKAVKETPTQLLLLSLVRPMKLLIFSPIVLSLAMCVAVKSSLILVPLGSSSDIFISFSRRTLTFLIFSEFRFRIFQTLSCIFCSFERKFLYAENFW